MQETFFSETSVDFQWTAPQKIELFNSFEISIHSRLYIYERNALGPYIFRWIGIGYNLTHLSKLYGVGNIDRCFLNRSSACYASQVFVLCLLCNVSVPLPHFLSGGKLWNFTQKT
jgi:hypothetical protein